VADFDPEYLDDDAALLAELGIDLDESQEIEINPREERICNGFSEIQDFVTRHGAYPRTQENHDIFERLLAVRLERLRDLKEDHALLAAFDVQGLLRGEALSLVKTVIDEMDDDALLNSLDAREEDKDDITQLRHVRSWSEKREAEEIANRQKCHDFAQFKPLFENVRRELQEGIRNTRPFVRDVGFSKADIKKGEFFILGGQIIYVAQVGQTIKAPNGEKDARLRLIYANGTESDLLLRSLQRALYKDETGRRISEPVAGPLFAENNEAGDEMSGRVYVLRSQSTHPLVAEHRDILHKIGVTGRDVRQRLSNARLDPTFLMADVELVATYELFNINRIRLEKLLHRIFDHVRLDIEIKDRFGQATRPHEWFFVPLQIIDEAIEKIRDETITDYVYDRDMAAFKLKTEIEGLLKT